MAEIQKEPANEKNELAELNKLIFRMHAEHVTTVPPDMRNAAGIPSKPRQTYGDSRISATVKEYQGLCDKDLQSKLEDAGLDDATKKVIEDKITDVSNSLRTLNASLSNKYGDWMENRRSMDKDSWDNSFSNFNASLKSLQETINQSIKTQTPPVSDGLKELQAAAQNLDGDKLKNKTFNEEVSRLSSSLTQQSRMDFGFRKATELGYGVGGTKKIWTKVHKSDQEKIEEQAKALGEAGANAGVVSVHPDDKTWDERLKNKGGAGLYQSEGSGYYMKVGSDGGITAIRTPEDSFFSHIAQSLKTIALAPFAPFLPSDYWEEQKGKVKSFWGQSLFERSFSEMLDFATIDPSGLQRAKSVTMSYDFYGKINSKEMGDVMTALQLAKNRGIGFNIHPDLADALAKVDGHKELFKAIDEWRAEFKNRESLLEKAGQDMQSAQQPPALPVPTAPALSDNAAKKITGHIKKADEIKVEMDAINPDEEKVKPEADKISVEALHMKADDLVKSLDDMDGIVPPVFHEGSEADINNIQSAVDGFQAAAVSIAKVADSDPIKSAIPMSAEPEKKEAYKNYQSVIQELKAKLVEVRERCDASMAQVNERREELVIQGDLRELEQELNVNPNTENQSLKSAVDHASDNLDYFSKDDTKREGKEDTIKAYAEKTQEAVTKLEKKGPGNEDTIKKAKDSIEQIDNTFSAAPSPKPK